MRKNYLKAMLALCAAAFAPMVSGAGQASLTNSSAACSAGDIGSTPGVTFVDCSGLFVGNVLNQANFSAIKSVLATGSDLSDAWDGFGIKLVTRASIEKLDSTTTPVVFTDVLYGDVLIGLRWGGTGLGGDPGGNTALYRLTIDSKYNNSLGLNVLGFNPAGNGRNGALSGAALFLTDEVFPPALSARVSLAPVPEPEQYAMLFAGLGLLGFVARHRK